MISLCEAKNDRTQDIGNRKADQKREKQRYYIIEKNIQQCQYASVI